MIKRKGSLFDSTASALGHGVNVRGVMGAGIAKTFKEKFPKNYEYYRQQCNAGYFFPGGVLGFEEGDKLILNMASQAEPGANARYEAVFCSAYQAAQKCLTLGIDTVAIPMIGCGIGGLEWSKVEKVLLAVEDITDGDFQWEVWKL